MRDQFRGGLCYPLQGIYHARPEHLFFYFVHLGDKRNDVAKFSRICAHDLSEDLGCGPADAARFVRQGPQPMPPDSSDKDHSSFRMVTRRNSSSVFTSALATRPIALIARHPASVSLS